MREETRRKLERALWLDRAKKAGIAALILGVIAAFFLYEDYDSHVDKVRVPAPVVSIGPLNTTNTQAIEKGLSVVVELANGRHETVMVLKTTDPHVGDHVQVTEHRHRTGRINYTWK
jgi:hypothetical protein